MSHLAVPPECAIAFKEWQGIRDALNDGEQTIIIRKGGIEEGPTGFLPEYHAFWLYPTRVHEVQQGLKRTGEAPRKPFDPSGNTVSIDTLAVVEFIGRVKEEERLARLDEFHVWTSETLSKRFHYRSPGLWVLGVRIYRRDTPVAIAVTPEHAGCKTWVPLDEPIATAGLTPSLDDGQFLQRMAALREALAPANEA